MKQKIPSNSIFKKIPTNSIFKTFPTKFIICLTFFFVNCLILVITKEVIIIIDLFCVHFLFVFQTTDHIRNQLYLLTTEILLHFEALVKKK